MVELILCICVRFLIRLVKFLEEVTWFGLVVERAREEGVKVDAWI